MKGTIEYGVVYDESDTPEAEYGKGVTMAFQVDSDWDGRDEDSKSTTGWLVRLNNSVVFSGSKIQRRVATSTVEAETNGLETVFKEVEWYRDFLSELEIDVTPPTSVESDNAGALFFKAASAANIDRFVWFKNCMFHNAAYSAATTMTTAFSVHAAVGGSVILDGCSVLGVTDWSTDYTAVTGANMPDITAANAGFMETIAT